MLELTFFTPEAHVRSFTTSRIVIGAGSSDLADLPLPTMDWEAEHLIFMQDAQGIWAINQANDPFVLLENRPFSKRRLEAGSSYQITLRGLSILCRTSAQSGHEEPSTPSSTQNIEDDLTELLQEVENFPILTKTPSEREVSPPKSTPLLRLPKHPSPPMPSPTIHPMNPMNPLSASVFSSQGTLKTPIEEKVPEEDRAASMAWKLVLASGATVFLLVAAFSLTVYGAFTETSSQAEFLAAQDVADVGMALVHARLYPDKQKTYNLADPEFLRAHLSQLLGEEFPISLEMTPQGHLKESAYLLRLYTNQDISQFVIVAQPEPSFWYWLIHPHTIFLDSVTMQLHKTQDVRMVNRILAQPNLFQGTKLAALEPLFAKSLTVPLRTLSYEVNRREFAPPRELQKLRPGAENRIYNAPRYHRLGDPLFKMLTELKSTSSTENALVLENLYALSPFHNMVLYTIGSLHTAQKAVKALQTHFPEEQFLIGHMTLDKENHSLLSSHLVDPIPETPLLDPFFIVDAEKHPLQVKLEELAGARKKVIEPFTQEMLAQIASHTKMPSEKFYETMDDLLQRCKKVDAPSCQELRHTLAHFYLEHVIKEPRVAFTEFATYVESAGLTEYLPKENMRALPSLEEGGKALDLTPWTRKIQEATSLHALDRSLLMADQWLLDQSIPDHEQFLSMTQTLKTTAKLCLEQLLMNSKSIVSLKERQRPILLHILDTLLAVPPYEKEIYLKEFERHVENMENMENVESQGTTPTSSLEDT